MNHVAHVVSFILQILGCKRPKLWDVAKTGKPRSRTIRVRFFFILFLFYFSLADLFLYGIIMSMCAVTRPL